MHRSILRLATICLLAAGVLWGSSGTVASETPPLKKAPAKSAKAAAKAPERRESPRRVLVTGSLLPQRADSAGIPASPVQVIDRKAIETSGASSVAMLLRNRVPR